MIDYGLLELGMACQGHEEYNFCYEAVRDDFFEEITAGDDFFEEKFSLRKKEEPKKKSEIVKAWISENKKKLAILSAGLVLVAAAATQLRKNGHKTEAEILESELAFIQGRLAKLKKRYVETCKSIKDTKDAETFKQTTHQNMNHWVKEFDSVYKRYESVCKKYHIKKKNIDITKNRENW